MSQVLVKHKVNDYNVWKQAFDNFAGFRKSSGEKSYQILHPDSDPNNLTLLFDWDNEENAKRFMASDELKLTMQKAGVAEAPNIQFLSEAAKGSL